MSATNSSTDLPASVLHRLAAREAARQAKAAERTQSTGQQQSPVESVQLFWEDFERRRAAIDASLTRVTSSGDAIGDETGVADINTDLADAEQAVAQSAYFLPQYELRKADAVIKGLRQRLVDAGPAAAPQRRAFGFSRAVKRTSALQTADDAPNGHSTTPASVDERRHSSSVADGAAPTGAERDSQNGACSAAGDGPRLCDAADGRCLRSLAGRHVMLRGDSLGDGDFVLADLTDCSVWLLGRLSALRVERLTRCRVYGGPICGATFIQGAEGCTFMLASHQVRIHAARHCDFYLRLRSNPIIEDCSRLGFAPCPADLPLDPEQMAAAGLAEDTGLWAEVQDFLWLRSTPSPNWQVIDSDARVSAGAPPPKDAHDALLT